MKFVDFLKTIYPEEDLAPALKFYRSSLKKSEYESHHDLFYANDQGARIITELNPDSLTVRQYMGVIAFYELLDCFVTQKTRQTAVQSNPQLYAQFVKQTDRHLKRIGFGEDSLSAYQAFMNTLARFSDDGILPDADILSKGKKVLQGIAKISTGLSVNYLEKSRSSGWLEDRFYKGLVNKTIKHFRPDDTDVEIPEVVRTKVPSVILDPILTPPSKIAALFKPEKKEALRELKDQLEQMFRKHIRMGGAEFKVAASKGTRKAGQNTFDADVAVAIINETQKISEALGYKPDILRTERLR